MKNRRPLKLVITIALLVGIAFVNYFLQMKVWDEGFSDFQLKRERLLASYVRLAVGLAKENAIGDMQKVLKDAREARHIDYYILQSSNGPIFWGTADGKPDSLDVQYTVINQPVITKALSLITVDLGNENYLTVGIKKDKEAYLDDLRKSEFSSLAEETLIFVIVPLIIFSYYLKDILNLLGLLKEKDHRSFRRVRTRTLEGELLAQGLSGFDRTVDRLNEHNQVLGNQVLSSLKREIMSGRTPPYNFDCTLVRTDINNFSTIFHNNDQTKFMDVINDFFSEVTHVVSRYQGLVHEFVGDEVIFYFKDEDHENSFMIALSALKDINELAGKFCQFTLTKYGYPFTVKSSCSHGTIRFGRLVDGFSLAGSVLVETVRVLSHIFEKEGNVVCFEQNYLPFVVGDCEIQEYSRVHLKGFVGNKVLFQYLKHSPLNVLLEKQDEESFAKLGFYRSDEDLTVIVTYLARHWSDLSFELMMVVLGQWSDLKLLRTDGKPAQALMAWLNRLIVEGQNDSSVLPLEASKISKLLASLTVLIGSFVPKDKFDDEIETCLMKMMNLNDKRVVANAIEVLSQYKVEGHSSLLHQLSDSTNSRIKAAALIREGMSGINQNVLKTLKEMLRSKDVSSVASGLYALGEIAQYHKTKDLVYYSTQLEFMKLIMNLPNYLSFESEMIRRQAFIAARKCSEEKVIARMHAKAKTDKSKVLLKELNEYIVQSSTQNKNSNQAA